MHSGVNRGSSLKGKICEKLFGGRQAKTNDCQAENNEVKNLAENLLPRMHLVRKMGFEPTT